ncbi:MAG: aminotransferase class I/II-fold pyridoxal phosphate-dependent enzyme, partial [Desulfuromonadales bacterium]
MAIRDFRLERYFARWEFTAPYLLSASDCETMSVGELLDMAGVPLSALADLRLGYTESQGDPALRATIARFHSRITADDVVVTNAPEEAIFLSMMALLNPGDRVVVQTPCYQSLFEL